MPTFSDWIVFEVTFAELLAYLFFYDYSMLFVSIAYTSILILFKCNGMFYNLFAIADVKYK